MAANLERFFQLSKDLLVIGTPDGLPIMMSPSWTTLLGWSEEELKTIKAQELIHPDDLERTADKVEKSLRGEDIFSFTNRYRHKNGTYVSLIWTGTFSKEDGLIYAIAKDISDFAKVEERLKQSERRLKAAQKIAKIGSWDLALDLEEVDANKLVWSDQVFRIFGYEPGEIQVSNENFFKAVHPDDREKIRQAVAETVQTGKPYDIEHRICLPNGTEKIVHELSEVVFDPKTGKAKSLAGTVQDITEQKKLFNQLVGAQKMESIGRLAGGIAHDFNNLLAAIYGNLEMMEKEIPETHPAFRCLKNIFTTSKRAADLTNQLLAFSRQQVLTPTVQDLNSLVIEANKILGRLLGKDIEIHSSLAPNLNMIEVDSSQVIQIILNLAVNARDAMPNGGQLNFETSNHEIKEFNSTKPFLKKGNYVRLEVSDTGHGMDPSVLENIFEPFFTTKKPGSGTGLGLSTVYGIVKQSGGFITADSEVGKGTTFEVLFPMTLKNSNSLINSAGKKDKAIPTGHGKTILLIEDEKELRLILEETLLQSGYKVLTAGTGKEGLQMISDYHKDIDLLMTDVVLPGINGFELVKKARELRVGLPIICISGHSSRDIRSSIDITNLTFIQKPFQFSYIIEKIEEEILKASVK